MKKFTRSLFENIPVHTLAAFLFWSFFGDCAAATARSAEPPILAKITASPVFYHQLVPIGAAAPSEEESAALWKEVQDAGRSGFASVIPALEEFISNHPASPWIPSLRANLGRYYREHGRYTLALAHWESAWRETRAYTDGAGKKVADFTFAWWTKLLASLGRTETLQVLLHETDGRLFDAGSLQQMVNSTREAYRIMLTEPGICFKCGTFALISVGQTQKGAHFDRHAVDTVLSPTSGFSMATLADLACKSGLGLVPAEWDGQKKILVPSVIHWKQNHYAAITQEKYGKYYVLDPTFGKAHWLTAEEIQAEASGYFLIPGDKLGTGWRRLELAQTQAIYGRGFAHGVSDHHDACGNDSGGGDSGASDAGSPVDGDGEYCNACRHGGSSRDRSSPSDPTGNPGGGGSPPPCDDCEDDEPETESGMPFWYVSEPYINVWLYDRPLSYTPGLGPRVTFKLAYKQRDTRASSANAFGLGPHWNCSWLSYVQLAQDETDADSPTMFLPAGGEREYEQTGETNHEYFSYTTLQRSTDASTNTSGYTVTHRTGAKEKYNVVLSLDGVKRAFLTEKADRFGHTILFIYSTNAPIKLTGITDADGRTTTISYTNVNFPAQITGVTDPFGRQAMLKYDATGMLTNITDAIGLSSSFKYDGQGWMTNLTTPYGTTVFEHWINPHTLGDEFSTNNDAYLPIRVVRVIDAGGGTNVFMLRQDASNASDGSSVPDSYYFAFNPGQVPDPAVLPDNSITYGFLNYRDSFHWTARQAQGLPAAYTNFTTADYLRARMRHWLHEQPSAPTSGYVSQTLHMETWPSPDGTTLGRVIWYDYPREFSEESLNEGLESQPSLVTAVLPDGKTWFKWMRRDKWGHVTNLVETWSARPDDAPLRRTNVFNYNANGFDLIKVIGPRGETYSNYAYDGNHHLLYVTNAIGDVTSYSYDDQGRLINIRTPSGLNTSQIYFPTGDYTNFVQTRIDAEISRTNSYTYANDLVATHTDERSVTKTSIYDNLQRLTSIADPRGTVTYLYSNLDLVKVTDRLGLTTSFVYDNMRRMIFQTNSLGCVTAYNYCSCGALDSIRDAAGSYSYFHYNNASWLTNMLDPDGYSQSRQYDLLGRVTATWDVGGHGVTNYYNNQGLLCAVSNAFGLVLLSIFDVEDRATNHLDPNNVSVNSTFDDLGRVLTRSYPDGGTERFGYSARGLITYTNQLNFGAHYAYDEAHRKVAETNANNEVAQSQYDSSGNLTQHTDGKNQSTIWHYDEFSRVTNKVDAAANIIFKYSYDGDNRLTNRWTPAKGTTAYSYDAAGNLLSINYPTSPAINFTYDLLNRMTNMVDAIGTNKYTYDAAGQLLSVDGPLDDDTLSLTYSNRLRTGLSLAQHDAGAWTQSYAYDDAKRLTSISSPVGTFSYAYHPLRSMLPALLALPGGSSVTNIYDSSARLLGTWLLRSDNSVLNSHVYDYNQGNQRTRQTFKAGNYDDYTYDPIGQLKTAQGKEAGGATNRFNEQFGYTYDAVGNLNWRTNNELLQQFAVNSLNELTTISRNTNMTVIGRTTGVATNVTVNGLNAAIYTDYTFARTNVGLVDGNNTFTAIATSGTGFHSTNTTTSYLPTSISQVYDLNGNLRTNGTRVFEYDDENQLIRITEPTKWKSEFAYDGKMRRRVRSEYAWFAGGGAGGTWQHTNEVRYIYDSNLVIQERWYNPLNDDDPFLQNVTYTRGRDLSSSLEGAGGIGGLLARTASLSNVFSSLSYYHADGSGNVTCLVNSNQVVIAKYLYDPYGKEAGNSGPDASSNPMRFSSSELHPNSGFLNFPFRVYDPSAQRWLTRDPTEELGGENLYEFCLNSPIDLADPWGFAAVSAPPPGSPPLQRPTLAPSTGRPLPPVSPGGPPVAPPRPPEGGGGDRNGQDRCLELALLMLQATANSLKAPYEGGIQAQLDLARYTAEFEALGCEKKLCRPKKDAPKPKPKPRPRPPRVRPLDLIPPLWRYPFIVPWWWGPGGFSHPVEA